MFLNMCYYYLLPIYLCPTQMKTNGGSRVLLAAGAVTVGCSHILYVIVVASVATAVDVAAPETTSSASSNTAC